MPLPRAATLDARSGKSVVRNSSRGAPDMVFHDQEHKRLYVPGIIVDFDTQTMEKQRKKEATPSRPAGN
jgi:hypothetical protein